MTFSLIQHRLQGPSKPFLLGGSVETASTLQLSVDVVVSYPDGSTDSLPARTLALLPDGITTVFDRSVYKWIGYTVKGSGVLSVVKETDLSTLDGIICPLTWITEDACHYWQLVKKPVVELSNALQGSAEATGVPIALSNDVTQYYATEIFGWFHLGGVIADEEAVLQLYTTGSDSNPLCLTLTFLPSSGDGTLNWWGVHYQFNGKTDDFSPFEDIVPGAANIAAWYFASVVALSPTIPLGSPVNVTADLFIQIWDQGGNYVRRARTGIITGAPLTSNNTAGTLGFGKSVAGGQSFVGSWPNDPDWLMTDVGTRTTTVDGTINIYDWMTPPTAHISGAGYDAAYNFSGVPVGTHSGWTDDSGNGHDISGDITLVASSPYPFAGYAVPGMPTLSSPSDGAFVGASGGSDPPDQLVLDWSTTGGITDYDAEFSINDATMALSANAFGGPNTTSDYPNHPITSDPPWTDDTGAFPTNQISTNYWRIAYLSPEGIRGAWSDIWSFTGDFATDLSSVYPPDLSTYAHSTPVQFGMNLGSAGDPGFGTILISTSPTVGADGILSSLFAQAGMGGGGGLGLDLQGFYNFATPGIYYWQVVDVWATSDRGSGIKYSPVRTITIT